LKDEMEEKRMKIKTTFWEDEDLNSWRNKTFKIIVFFGIIILSNTGYYIFNESWIMAIYNGIIILFVYIMWSSHVKYLGKRYLEEKEEWKQN